MKNLVIDRWFPINEVSVESVRERSASSALPPIYFLHVWFARRPLTTCRAAIITSILEKVDKKQIFSLMGIPHDKDLLKAQNAVQEARATKRKLNINPYSWERAFKHVPTSDELAWLHRELKSVWGGRLPILLDPMAGGGSIPYEGIRLGLPVIAGDLNPVAYVILKATLEYPAKFRNNLIPSVTKFCNAVHTKAKAELEKFFPGEGNEKVFAYLWARTLRCPSCNLTVPLSPNWWVAKTREPTDRAAKLIVPKQGDGDECTFEIIETRNSDEFDPDEGTDIAKEARCPRCLAKIDGDQVKKIAQSKRMGHQLYVICTKQHLGARKLVWRFRTPSASDHEAVRNASECLQKKLSQWKRMGILPLESFPATHNDMRPLHYGMYQWIDFFNPRQLLIHMTYLEKYLEEKDLLLRDPTIESEFAIAVLVYGAMVFDTCVDYNSILTRWRPTRTMMAGTMAMQAYPFKSSYAEWNQLVEGGGYLWSMSKVLDSLKDLIKMLPPSTADSKIINTDAAALPLSDNSIDAVVVDPPYHDNVMYAEMSDFFYVWLKKLIGDLFQESFSPELTNKMDEAVASIALYRDTERPKNYANAHYAAKMLASFKEMRRVLRDDGILTIMFTHRKVEAWSELTRALSEAGFTFKASWPVLTEPGDKFGKADKGVLKVTILLSCRKRGKEKRGLWSEVQRELSEDAEKYVIQYARQGLTGMNLLVSIYGPILGKYADYSLIKDSYGNTIGPEKALDIVSEVVNRFNTQELTGADLDTLAYINLLKNFPLLVVEEDLARVTTVFGGQKNIQELATKGGRGMVEKKAGKVTILLSADRYATGHVDISKPEDLKSLIDIVHAALITYEKLGVSAVKELLSKTGREVTDSSFISVLKIISSLGLNGGISKKLTQERDLARLLMEALGHQPESFTKAEGRMEYYL